MQNTQKFNYLIPPYIDTIKIGNTIISFNEIKPYKKPEPNIENISIISDKGHNQNQSQKECEDMPIQGSLFQRQDGRWESRITFEGKQYYVKSSVYKTVCADALKEAIRLKRKGLLKNKLKPVKEIKEAQNAITFYKWIEDWLEKYKKGKIKDHSYTSIEICIRLHTKPHIPDCQLDQLSTESLQTGLKKIKSSKMREYTYNTLFECLEKARKLRLIDSNPIIDVEIPKHIRQPGKALTKKQEEEFLKAIENSKHKNIYLFQLYSGCRPGTPYRIKKEHIDYDNNSIFLDETKSENAPRYIPLFDNLKKLLKNLTKTNNEYIFESTPGQIKKDFTQIKKKLKFKMTQKDLRHTFCTRCMEAGIPLKIIQKWMGHASINTTAKIYTHVLSEQEQLEAKKLNENHTNFHTKKKKDD